MKGAETKSIISEIGLNSDDKKKSQIGLLAICAIGLVLLALIALRSGGGDPDADVVELVDEKIAVRVNNQPIYQRDVDDWLQANNSDETSNPEEAAISALIDRRLLASAAKSAGIDTSKDVASDLRRARNRILATAYINNHIDTQVTDQALRQLYDAQSDLRRGGIQRRAQQILVPDRETADEVVSKLDRGDSFQSLALAYSLDRASRETGGDMGFFSRGSFPPDFSGPVFAAEIGNRIGPFETERGWHIVEILGQRPTPNPAFEDIKDELREFLTARAVNSLMENLRNGAEIVYPEPETPTLQPALQEPADG